MDAFDTLLASYAVASQDAERKQITAELWDSFGMEGAVFVLDMSGFSLLTRRHGIVYYLSMVRRMQRIVRPIIEQQGGQVVKFEADNCFAFLPKVINAIQAGIEINRATKVANQESSESHGIEVACGIDFGKFLLINDSDYFGDAVNRASKLGEDLSKPGEILVADSAIGLLEPSPEVQHESVTFSISGMRLDAHRVIYTC